MKLKDLFFKSDSHIVIVGRSGSGKTHTVARIIQTLINYRKRFILLDWSGEYNIIGFSHSKPRFSYPLLKSSLAEVLSEMIRLQSQTAGTWTYDSVAKAVEESNSFTELLQKLKENSEFPVRDSGAKAAYIRLNMLSKYFTDKEMDEIPWHVDFSSLDVTSRKMALTFYLVQLYNMIIRKQSHNYFLIIEEALNIPENLLKQLLTQLRGYNIRVILTTQEFREWFLQYNLILHDLGGNNHHLIYKHGIPSQFHKLKIGEVLMFWVEKHKWKKMKVGMAEYVKILPKYENNTPQEDESKKTQNTVEEEEKAEEEDNTSESNDNQSTDTSKDDSTKAEEKVIKDEEEQLNNNNSSEMKRILDEHKALAEEITELKYKLNAVEGAISKLSEKKNDNGVEARLLGLGNDIAKLNSKIRELSEKLDSLENYVTKTFSEIMEKLDDLEHKTEYLDTRIDEESEKIKNSLTEYVDEKIKKEADEVFNTVAENGANSVKIANNFDKYIDEERKKVKQLIPKATFIVDNAGYIVVKTAKSDWIENFDEVNNIMKTKLGYKRLPDPKYDWCWKKTIPINIDEE